MNVRDLMEQDVVTINASDHLDLVDDIMRLGRFRHMPVMSGTKLVGIVSQRDLFRASISSVLQFRLAAEREWLARIAVCEVMTSDVCTIEPSAPMRTAVQLMLDKRIGCLPVLESGKLVGLLSESACMRCLAHMLDISQTKQQLPELRE